MRLQPKRNLLRRHNLRRQKHPKRTSQSLPSRCRTGVGEAEDES